MKQKETPLTHLEAINSYFGGVQSLAKSSFPFTCKCGGSTYQEKDKDLDMLVTRSIMHIEDLL